MLQNSANKRGYVVPLVHIFFDSTRDARRHTHTRTAAGRVRATKRQRDPLEREGRATFIRRTSPHLRRRRTRYSSPPSF